MATPIDLPTVNSMPGVPTTNVGSISNSTSTGNNSSNNSSQSTGSSASTGASGSTSFIPDFVQQLNFLNQFGNLAGSLSQQQYNWAQDQFANNSALTTQNINDYLKNSDMGFQGANRDFNNYNDIFTPAADSLTKDWQSYASPERVSSEMGAAEATQAQAFESQRKNIERSLESYGINPSDPRYAGSMAANRTAEGASQAAAGTAARLNTENTGRQLRQSALNEAHLLPGQTATEQNVAMQGLTGATNASFGNTSLGALTMGTTPQYLAQGVANTKFQPLGSVSGSTNQSGSANQSSSVGSSVGSSNSNSSSSPVLQAPTPNPNAPYGQQPNIPYTPGLAHPNYAEGGAIPEPGDDGGGMVPESMSPSGGQQVDDIPAVIPQTGGQARLNAREFVIPEDTVEWLGQKFFQDLIMKSRKARQMNPGPAHPTQGPGGEQHALGGAAGQPQVMPPAPSPPGQTTGSVNTPGGTAPQAGHPQVNGGPDLSAPGTSSGGGAQPGNTAPAGTRSWQDDQNQIAGHPQVNGGPDLGAPGSTGIPPGPGHGMAGGSDPLVPARIQQRAVSEGVPTTQLMSQLSGGQPQINGGPQTQPTAPGSRPPFTTAPVATHSVGSGNPPAAPKPLTSDRDSRHQGGHPGGAAAWAMNPNNISADGPATPAPAPGATDTAGAGERTGPRSKPAPGSAGGSATSVSPTAPQTSGPAPGAIPAQGQAFGQNAPLPTGHQLMEGGDYSVAVQHSAPGAASRLGQGLAAGQQGPGPFTPKPNYFTPPNPFVRQPTPAFTPVPNTRPPAPPTPASVIPPQPVGVQPPAPGPGGGGGGTPSGGGGGTPAVGAVGRGMNNDGRLHPMLPNDLDQLLTSGDQIAQQNAALYARHGIPMPGGVQFGNPNDPTSFAYQGQPQVRAPVAAPVTNSGQRGMFG